MSSQQLKQLLGRRILSEANDLKRTITSLASEIGYDENKLNNIVKGECHIDETYEVINRMGKHYPIDISDLYFGEDDCTNGVRFMREEESRKSSRIFTRKDRTGNRTPFYDYRDTAMSKLGPFKPEWIKELRVVDNNDPYNPDIAYNNGHFLHQMTFFIGPVNFYWEVNGKKYCTEMNTGDSNYITPFWPHSFASRDANQLALIIAVTYGGDVRRSQKELYNLGGDKIQSYLLDYRNHNRATVQLIKQHLANENLTEENFKELVKQKNVQLDADKVLNEKTDKTFDELSKVAGLLNCDVSDLLIPLYEENQEVVVKYRQEKEGYFFPSAKRKLYRVWPLARCAKMPLMKGSDVEILSQEASLDDAFTISLHSYVFNYGDAPFCFTWMNEGKTCSEEVQPGDSIYIQPFVKHACSNTSNKNGKFFTIRVSGAVNYATQKELSYFADSRRIIESKCWFD